MMANGSQRAQRMSELVARNASAPTIAVMITSAAVPLVEPGMAMVPILFIVMAGNAATKAVAMQATTAIVANLSQAAVLRMRHRRRSNRTR